MILTKAQAETVYSAMVALNNIGGRISANFPTGNEEINVFERADGTVSVWQRNHGLTHNDETHANQIAFAAAYGLTA